MDDAFRFSAARRGDERSANVPDSPCSIPRRRVLITIGGGTAVVIAGCLGDDTDEITYQVVYLHNDNQTEVETLEGEAMLYPALDAGVDIPYSCEIGRCGQCTAKYDGDANDVVDHDGNQYLENDQITEGWVLTCVAYARDDFELEVTHPDDQ